MNPSPSGILSRQALSIIAGSGENGGSQVQFIPLTFKETFNYDKNQRAFNVNGTVALSSPCVFPTHHSPCCCWPVGILGPGFEGSHKPQPHYQLWLATVGAGGEAGDLSSHCLFFRCRSTHSFLDGPCVVSPYATLYFANLLPFPFLTQDWRSRTGGMWFYLLLFIFFLKLKYTWCTILCKLQLYNIVIYNFYGLYPIYSYKILAIFHMWYNIPL